MVGTSATAAAIAVVLSSCVGSDSSEADTPVSVETTVVVPIADITVESRPDGPAVPIVSTGSDELRDLIRVGDPSSA
ncbi:MAG: hypothetical protein AB8G14_18425 [Ilumatobacter sp.]